MTVRNLWNDLPDAWQLLAPQSRLAVEGLWEGLERVVHQLIVDSARTAIDPLLDRTSTARVRLWHPLDPADDFALPPYTLSVPTLQDTILDPDTTWTDGTDYTLVDNTLAWRVAAPTAVVWAKRLTTFNDRIEALLAARVPGLTAFAQDRPEVFLQAVRGLWYCSEYGPTTARLRAACALLLGLPTADAPGRVMATTATQLTLRREETFHGTCDADGRVIAGQGAGQVNLTPATDQTLLYGTGLPDLDADDWPHAWLLLTDQPGRRILEVHDATQHLNVLTLDAARVNADDGHLVEQDTLDFTRASRFDLLRIQAPAAVMGTYRIDSVVGVATKTTANTMAAAATIEVVSTTEFLDSGTLVLEVNDEETHSVSYTGKTATSFTGCTGVPVSATGAEIVQGRKLWLADPLPAGTTGLTAVINRQPWIVVDRAVPAATAGVVVRGAFTWPDDLWRGAWLYDRYQQGHRIVASGPSDLMIDHPIPSGPCAVRLDPDADRDPEAVDLPAAAVPAANERVPRFAPLSEGVTITDYRSDDRPSAPLRPPVLLIDGASGSAWVSVALAGWAKGDPVRVEATDQEALDAEVREALLVGVVAGTQGGVFTGELTKLYAKGVNFTAGANPVRPGYALVIGGTEHLIREVGTDNLTVFGDLSATTPQTTVSADYTAGGTTLSIEDGSGFDNIGRGLLLEGSTLTLVEWSAKPSQNSLTITALGANVGRDAKIIPTQDYTIRYYRLRLSKDVPVSYTTARLARLRPTGQPTDRYPIGQYRVVQARPAATRTSADGFVLTDKGQNFLAANRPIRVGDQVRIIDETGRVTAVAVSVIESATELRLAAALPSTHQNLSGAYYEIITDRHTDQAGRLSVEVVPYRDPVNRAERYDRARLRDVLDQLKPTGLALDIIERLPDDQVDRTDMVNHINEVSPQVTEYLHSTNSLRIESLANEAVAGPAAGALLAGPRPPVRWAMETVYQATYTKGAAADGITPYRRDDGDETTLGDGTFFRPSRPSPPRGAVGFVQFRVWNDQSKLVLDRDRNGPSGQPSLASWVQQDGRGLSLYLLIGTALHEYPFSFAAATADTLTWSSAPAALPAAPTVVVRLASARGLSL